MARQLHMASAEPTVARQFAAQLVAARDHVCIENWPNPHAVDDRSAALGKRLWHVERR
jgi:hypothetical protein